MEITPKKPITPQIPQTGQFPSVLTQKGIQEYKEQPQNQPDVVKSATMGGFTGYGIPLNVGPVQKEEKVGPFGKIEQGKYYPRLTKEKEDELIRRINQEYPNKGKEFKTNTFYELAPLIVKRIEEKKQQIAGPAIGVTMAGMELGKTDVPKTPSKWGKPMSMGESFKQVTAPARTVVKGAGELGTSFARGLGQIVPRTVAGTLDLVGLDEIAQTINQYTDKLIEKDKEITKSIGLEPESIISKVGETTGKIGGEIGLGITGIGALNKITKARQIVKGISNSYVRNGLKLMLGTAEGLAGTEITSIAGGEKATPTELKRGAALGGAGEVLVGSISKGMDVYKNFMKRQLPEQVKTAAGTLATDTYDDIVKIAKEYKGDISKPSGLQDLQNKIYNTLDDKVFSKTKELGKKIGTLREEYQQAKGTLKTNAKGGIDDLSNIINQKGGKININNKGKAIIKDKADEILELGTDEQKVYEYLYEGLNKLNKNKNATWEQVDKLFRQTLKNYDELVKIGQKAKNPEFVSNIYKVRDGLEQFFDKKIGPEFADLRKSYSEYKRLEDYLERFITKKSTMKPGEKVLTPRNIKKIFSPDSTETKEALEVINKVTGIDFTQEARMVKFVGELFEDPTVTNLLQNTQIKLKLDKSIIDKAWDKVTDIILSPFAENPVEIARQFIKGYDDLPQAKKQEMIKNYVMNVNNMIKSFAGIGEKDLESNQ